MTSGAQTVDAFIKAVTKSGVWKALLDRCQIRPHPELSRPEFSMGQAGAQNAGKAKDKPAKLPTSGDEFAKRIPVERDTATSKSEYIAEHIKSARERRKEQAKRASAILRGRVLVRQKRLPLRRSPKTIRRPIRGGVVLIL